MTSHRINTAIFWATLALLHAYWFQNATDALEWWISAIAGSVSILGLWWTTRKPRDNADG